MRDLRLTLPSAAGPVNILRGIDLDIAAGEAVGLVGPSGSGKTSLLMLLAGLERASGGSVQIGGVEITGMDEDARARLRRGIGIVYQAFHLIPAMTALENVSVALELAGRRDAARAATAALAAVGLGHRLRHLPGQLSGGEQQRVAIARAFAVRPRLLLADEPTGNLDQATGAGVIELLFRLRAEHGTALLLITHDEALAGRCGRRLRMEDGKVGGGGVCVSLALRLAARELRGGVRGLGIVLLCLALGVGAIAAVGSLRAAVEGGLAANGRALLGGDVEVQTGAEPPPPALISWLRARGALVSELTELRSLLVAPSGRRELIDLKAVDPEWPLVGAAVLAPPLPLASALAAHDGRFGLLADPLVLDRFGLRPGAVVRVGSEAFTLSAALVSAPDRVASPALFGAPVVIATAALPAAGLVVPGAIVTHKVRAAMRERPIRVSPAPSSAAFPDRGWRVRGPADAAPGVGRFIDQMALFMSLVGLTALLVGGVGVASGTRAWLETRARSLAILRCLGASARLVFAVCAIQAGGLALAASCSGSASARRFQSSPPGS